MESGWILNYKSGQKVIMNETAYQEFKNEGDISSEEHWFDMDKAIKDNPGLEILVM